MSHEELKKRIAAQLPAQFKALTGEEVTEEQSNVLGDQFAIFQIILTAFAIIAAFVGIFLIYNTFNIIVAQRSRELALLRAMGASWGQVVGAVMLEALIVGGVGATSGVDPPNHRQDSVGFDSDCIFAKMIFSCSIISRTVRFFHGP